MCLVVEIIMLVGGLYTLVTAKVPSLLVGGGRRTAEGTPARVIGAVLMLPLPAAVLAGMALAFLFGEQGVQYAYWLEIALIIGAGLLAVILMRVAGRPMEHASDAEALIAKKAQGALMYALLGLTGVGGIIGCPLAFMYAGQALRLIDEHQVGLQYRNRAKTARTIAGVATTLWVLGVVCILSTVLASQS